MDFTIQIDVSESCTHTLPNITTCSWLTVSEQLMGVSRTSWHQAGSPGAKFTPEQSSTRHCPAHSSCVFIGKAGALELCSLKETDDMYEWSIQSELLT